MRQQLNWVRVVLATFVVAVFIAVPTTSARAQVAGLTADQQRLLNQLPASQRQALMDRFLGSAGRPDNSDDVEDEEDEDSDSDELPSAELPIQQDVFAVGDTLVLMPLLEDEATTDPAILALRDRVSDSNPYVVSKSGLLEIPGLSGIALIGLDEGQAKIRLEADPEFAGIDVEVFRLPVKDLSGRALAPFGYDLFRDSKRSSRPDSSMPVPADYVLGPGDVVRIQLYGNQNAEYEIKVDRNGELSLPELGPFTVAGLSMDAVRKDVESRVSEQMIGTQVSTTLGRLRSIQVVLVGDVVNPGTYTVSALTTMADVLFVAGGVQENGSLRNIQLKRSGRTLATLDLYKLLMEGDSSRNRRVASGDVIFVPPVGARFIVTGSVKRPAVYEMKGKLSAAEAIKLAGGATAEGDLRAAKIERSDAERGVSILDIDLNSRAGKSTAIIDGDYVEIPAKTRQFDSVVNVVGKVDRPGQVQWSEGLTIASILPNGRALAPNADIRYVLITREVQRNGDIKVFSVDLETAWRAPTDKAANPTLHPRDTVYVFAKSESRANYLEPVLDQLRMQGHSGDPTPVVRIRGQVKVPGEYPLEEGMTVADLVRAGGGLAESAYRASAELTRYQIDQGRSRATELLEIQLADALAGDASANILLSAFDYMNVKEVSRWREDDIVEIKGEVLFPGKYPIYQGEPLTSVIRRAGGLTSYAFPAGSVFTRDTLKVREREQLDVLARRVEGDLAALALSDPGQTEAISIGQSLLGQLKSAEPAGRLVIDLKKVLTGDENSDVLLRDGDLLVIPPMTQEVTVLGEVQYATSHLWEPGLSRDDYINRSGGVNVKADKRRIYVVRANGEVVVSNRSRFFSKSRGFDIEAGDSIVVPLDTDRVKPLVLWTSATQILYNLAIAAAAANSF